VEGSGAGDYGQSLRRRLSISIGKYAIVFQAEMYAILTCAYEIHVDVRPEKYISIGCGSQVALKPLEAAKITYNSNVRH
jgi:hypothetical protein